MLIVTEDLRAADAAAVRAGVAVVERVSVADLGLATPCAGWDLGDLLGHMTAQHRGFAAAARGHGDDPGAWVEERAGADAVREYVLAAGEVLETFAGEGEAVLERTFHLPEAGGALPARLAIGMHLVDYAVHGWDVARTIGAAYRLDDDVLAATLEIVRAVPDGPGRLAPGSPFGPGRAVPAGAGPLDEILLRLGRDPAGS
ncbi:TIGR03086 family metal-binding protein [Actinoplanes sp. G11-F43]|uniref:TIGR03086 family metal-binding protein n=1 Tax=Actinoplanes sp. G11-F43 TaxID=3424130 RepID=UPI003D352E0E